jgi:hypothetical protein
MATKSPIPPQSDPSSDASENAFETEIDRLTALRDQAVAMKAEHDTATEETIAASPEKVLERLAAVEERVDWLMTSLSDVLAYHGPRVSTDPTNVTALV